VVANGRNVRGNPANRGKRTRRGVRERCRSTAAASRGSRVIDLSVRPVESERGDLVSIVVEGVDITERVDLERDLRQSEKLHRVTLNNMTDTILITDETGEYTYVCPNVHFISATRSRRFEIKGRLMNSSVRISSTVMNSPQTAFSRTLRRRRLTKPGGAHALGQRSRSLDSGRNTSL